MERQNPRRRRLRRRREFRPPRPDRPELRRGLRRRERQVDLRGPDVGPRRPAAPDRGRQRQAFQLRRLSPVVERPHRILRRERKHLERRSWLPLHLHVADFHGGGDGEMFPHHDSHREPALLPRWVSDARGGIAAEIGSSRFRHGGKRRRLAERGADRGRRGEGVMRPLLRVKRGLNVVDDVHGACFFSIFTCMRRN